MNISQMHYEFKVGIDRDTLSLPNFEPEEIDVFLNNAIEKFVSQRAFGNNPKKESYEETQKRLDDLRELTKNVTVTAFNNDVNNKPYGVFVELPSEYRHAINEECLVQYSDCNNNMINKRVSVISIKHDRYNKIINDPFNKPYNKEIARLAYGDNLFELIGDVNTTIVTYYLRYIKTPITVKYGSVYQIPEPDIDCDLAQHTHKEIIKMAIVESLGNIESQKVVIAKTELNEIE